MHVVRAGTARCLNPHLLTVFVDEDSSRSGPEPSKASSAGEEAVKPRSAMPMLPARPAARPAGMPTLPARPLKSAQVTGSAGGLHILAIALICVHYKLMDEAAAITGRQWV